MGFQRSASENPQHEIRSANDMPVMKTTTVLMLSRNCSPCSRALSTLSHPTPLPLWGFRKCGRLSCNASNEQKGARSRPHRPLIVSGFCKNLQKRTGYLDIAKKLVAHLRKGAPDETGTVRRKLATRDAAAWAGETHYPTGMSRRHIATAKRSTVP
jgi:hypothetical protein